MEYQIKTEKNSEVYKSKEVHYWKPPCSCGVGLEEVSSMEDIKEIIKPQKDVHFWKPPCSCGVSLDEVSEE